MQYREYGKTGKKLSVIGFGGMRFDKRDEGIKAIIRAYELGINYFDTAPSYCMGESEGIIGEGLLEIKRRGKEVYISTKSDARTPDGVRRDLEMSLKRLGVERIHFYHMWCIMNLKDFEERTKSRGAYQGFLRAKHEKLIEHIAFSTHASGDEIAKMCESNLFEGVTLGLNIVNHPYRIKGLSSAKRYKIGVVTMNPLGGGLLTSESGKFSFLKNKGLSYVQGILRFNVMHPEITVVLTGMGKVSEVEENAVAGMIEEQPSKEFIEHILERYRSLGDDFCTTCGYCEPCPLGINIHAYMVAYDFHRTGNINGGKDYLSMERQISEDGWVPPYECNECKECEDKCTQHIPIVERLKVASRIYS